MRRLYDIVIDPTTGANVYIAAPEGMFVSNDHGTTWTSPTMDGLGTSLDVNQATPSTVYCAANYTGINKSVDSGTTWDKVEEINEDK